MSTRGTAGRRGGGEGVAKPKVSERAQVSNCATKRRARRVEPSRRLRPGPRTPEGIAAVTRNLEKAWDKLRADARTPARLALAEARWLLGLTWWRPVADLRTPEQGEAERRELEEALKALPPVRRTGEPKK